MEDRPGLEFEAPFLRPPDIGTGEIGRQQVGGELDTRKTGIHPRRQRPDRRGLGQARRAFDQQMAIGQQGDQQALDQQRLANDLAGQRIAQCGEFLMQARVGGRHIRL
ncbi:hypothetical protein D3C81_951100 [compost metagenome]